MNQNVTTYFGSITEITEKDQTSIPLYESVLHPSYYSDSLVSRKLSCVMMSNFIDYIDLPEKVMLNLNILCVDTEVEASYPILSLTGNCDAIVWMLNREIEILTGQEQPVIQDKKASPKRNTKVKNEIKEPPHPVRSDRLGFEYANRN